MTGGRMCEEVEVQILGESLKEAVVVKCLKASASKTAHSSVRKLVLHTLSSHNLSNLSFVPGGDMQEQQNLLKNVVAGAVAEVLTVIFDDDDFAKSFVELQSGSSGSDSRYTSNASSKSTQIASSNSTHADVISTTGSCRSHRSQGASSDTSSSASKRAYTAGDCEIPNTPKVLKMQDFQCYFCGFKGSKDKVRCIGRHHGTGAR